MKIMPNFMDVQRLQDQYAGYSYNLAGGAPPNLAMEFISLPSYRLQPI